jgi:hypothetical protein
VVGTNDASEDYLFLMLIFLSFFKKINKIKLGQGYEFIFSKFYHWSGGCTVSQLQSPNLHVEFGPYDEVPDWG